MNVVCGCVKFYAWKMINIQDILVQKIKVIKVPAPSFHCLFTNVCIDNIS